MSSSFAFAGLTNEWGKDEVGIVVNALDCSPSVTKPWICVRNLLKSVSQWKTKSHQAAAALMCNQHSSRQENKDVTMPS